MSGETEVSERPLYEIVEDEHPFRHTPRRVARACINGVHLSVVPDDLLRDQWQGGYGVYFFADRNGEPDTGTVLNSGVVDGGPDDLEEIADTYSRRLAAGIEPEDMFEDIEEVGVRAMRRIMEGVKKGE